MPSSVVLCQQGGGGPLSDKWTLVDIEKVNNATKNVFS